MVSSIMSALSGMHALGVEVPHTCSQSCKQLSHLTMRPSTARFLEVKHIYPWYKTFVMLNAVTYTNRPRRDLDTK